jgi:hypothetical protein
MLFQRKKNRLVSVARFHCVPVKYILCNDNTVDINKNRLTDYSYTISLSI